MKVKSKITAILIITVFAVLSHANTVYAQNFKSADRQNTTKKTAVAILAGGCFWCVESDLDELTGVLSTVSGYTGGNIDHPTYENYHDTGKNIRPHVEAVEVTYDPVQLSYMDLLRYYAYHTDVLDGKGQFCDRGPAYRPVIFTANNAENEAAGLILEEAEVALEKKVAVEILPAGKFWPAEEYHQDFHHKNSWRYSTYRWNCGRDARVKELWGSK